VLHPLPTFLLWSIARPTPSSTVEPTAREGSSIEPFLGHLCCPIILAFHLHSPSSFWSLSRAIHTRLDAHDELSPCPYPSHFPHDDQSFHVGRAPRSSDISVCRAAPSRSSRPRSRRCFVCGTTGKHPLDFRVCPRTTVLLRRSLAKINEDGHLVSIDGSHPGGIAAHIISCFHNPMHIVLEPLNPRQLHMLHMFLRVQSLPRSMIVFHLNCANSTRVPPTPFLPTNSLRPRPRISLVEVQFRPMTMPCPAYEPHSSPCFSPLC
jgi:hypothetical protein